MGKKVKKLAKQTVGAFTFGVVGENVYGTNNPITGLTGQNAVIAAEAQAKKAQEQQGELARQQQIIKENATSLAANSAVDNTATVVAGGSAEAADPDLKRKRVASLSSTLGV
jgi:hypothetical protein